MWLRLDQSQPEAKTEVSQAYAVRNAKAVCFGRSYESRAEQKYHQAIAEWLAAGKQLPVDPNFITVKGVLSRFWTHAREYYRALTDGRVKELEQFRLAVRPLEELYGGTRASRRDMAALSPREVSLNG